MESISSRLLSYRSKRATTVFSLDKHFTVLGDSKQGLMLHFDKPSIGLGGPNNAFLVEKIMDHKTFRGKTEYLVKWAGYTDEGNTWQTAFSLRESKDEIRRYHKRLKGEPSSEPEVFLDSISSIEAVSSENEAKREHYDFVNEELSDYFKE